MENGLLSKILEVLDRSMALPELNPKQSGSYFSLQCPSCQQPEAYISKRGYYIRCNRQNNCGYVKGIVDYVSERDGVPFTNAVRTLGTVAGVEVPELTEQETEAQARRQEAIRLCGDISAIASGGLWANGGDAVEYLNARGYNDAEIMKMGFGFLPNTNDLKKHLAKKGHTVSLIAAHTECFRDSHRLLLPCYNEYGGIVGFITRTISPNVTPKYLYPKGIEIGRHFYNIHEARAGQDLVIVEGVLDALLLTQRGVPAVACGGSAPTENQINHALKRGGVERVVLCLDGDEAGQKGTERAIELFKNQVGNIYVVNTNPHKDADEYVKELGIERFKDLINRAESWVKWLAHRIISKYDVTTDRGRDRAKDELLELEEAQTDALNSEHVKNVISNLLQVSGEALSDLFLTFHEKRAKEKTKDAYSNLLKTACELERGNRHSELVELLSTRPASINSVAGGNKVCYTLERARADVEQEIEGLKTGYAGLDKIVTIPNGAITLIAGRPSHGKTTLLMNLLLNMVELYRDKTFYFYSYEEGKTALFVKLLNILAGYEIDEERYNVEQFRRYIKLGNSNIREINEAIEKYDGYTKTERLWLIDEPLTVEQLVGRVEADVIRRDVGAVFIDYAQKIRYDGKYDTERVKIARISDYIREASVRLKIPIILGAQLNRENANSKPRLEGLKEAGNLEEDANLVLGIYNWNVAVNKENTKESKKDLSSLVQTDVRNIDFEVSVLKNRDGAVNKAAMLKFNAQILKISGGVEKQKMVFCKTVSIENKDGVFF